MKFKVKINEGEIRDFKVEANPSFGTNHLPITLWFDLTHKRLVPEKIKISSRTDFSMSCFNSTLHYGQSIFEGIKAYSIENGKIGVFRLDDYAKRFTNSARIMGMPEIPEEIFKSCIKKYLECCRELLPENENLSIYLRPLLIANDNVIKVKPSDNYRFFIMGSIVGSYFTGDKVGTKVYCDPKLVRAFPGGCGEAKTSANYALSLPSLVRAKSLGFEQVLYLNSENKKFIDELGGMNFFMIKDNKVITPKLGGTILSGITRKTVLDIAAFFEIEAIEDDIDINDLIKPGFAQAIFASGTAATVVPIIELGFQSGEELKIYKFEDHEYISKIRTHLEKCHRNKSPLSKKWVTVI